MFGILNFGLIIPLLDILFDKVSPLELHRMSIKPIASFSPDYVIDSFYYNFGLISTNYGKVGALRFVCGIIIGSVFLANVFRYLTQRILENLKAHTVSKIRQAAFENTIGLHLGFFSNERKGNLMSRITTDVQEVENSVVGSFNAAFKEPVSIVLYFTFLFSISVQLTLFTLIVIPVSGALISMLVKKLKRDAQQGQESLSRIISILDETFGGMRIVKGFNAKAYIEKKFSQENQFYKKVVRKMGNKREMASPFSEFMGVSMAAGILLYGGTLVLSGESDLTASQFIGYIIMFSQVLRPVKEISNAFSNIQRGLASGERVLELIDTVPAIQDKPNAIKIKQFEHSIEFKNVSFSYESNKHVLKNINFSIEKGKTIALVGSSGGGKSTIADLLPRFYDPTAGAILIDGKDLRDCDIDSLRDQMGIVTQESILFNDSIFNNIAFGTDATMEEVILAAKVANAHQFIVQTSDGYQTFIGDRGAKLSGGQRQRISIARAVLKNPAILILDEATSALDTESEKLVQEALTNLMKNRTSLVIAHRLSTIQHADEILVMQHGEIAERGHHDDLLELENGIYKKLNLMQAI